MSEYHTFMRKWNKDEGINSFYGSDKERFLRDWNEFKIRANPPKAKGLAPREPEAPPEPEGSPPLTQRQQDRIDRIRKEREDDRKWKQKIELEDMAGEDINRAKGRTIEDRIAKLPDELKRYAYQFVKPKKNEVIEKIKDELKNWYAYWRAVVYYPVDYWETNIDSRVPSKLKKLETIGKEYARSLEKYVSMLEKYEPSYEEPYYEDVEYWDLSRINIEIDRDDNSISTTGTLPTIKDAKQAIAEKNKEMDALFKQLNG